MFACYAIIPSIQPHHGDMRRDWSPYMTTVGCSYGELNIANQAMRELNKRGIKCHMEIYDNIGIVK